MSNLPQDPTVPPAIWIGQAIRWTLSETSTNFLPVGYAEKIISGDGVNGWDWGVAVDAVRKTGGKAYIAARTVYAEYGANGEGDLVPLHSRGMQVANNWKSSVFGGWSFGGVAAGVSQHGGIQGHETNLFYAASSNNDGVPDHPLNGRYKYTVTHKFINEAVGFDQTIPASVGAHFGRNVNIDKDGSVSSGARVRTQIFNDQDYIAPEGPDRLNEWAVINGATKPELAYGGLRFNGNLTYAFDLWRGTYTKGLINLRSTDMAQMVRGSDGKLYLPISLDYASSIYGIPLDVIPQPVTKAN